MSKTQNAIAYMRTHNTSANAAAKACDVSVSAVLAGLKRERVKAEKAGQLKPCPCCDTRVAKFAVPADIVETVRVWREKNMA
jgi:hypothetical protein